MNTHVETASGSVRMHLVARRTVTGEQIAGYRGALRAGLAAPGTRQASPVHPFVLAHTLADQAVRALTEREEGRITLVHLGQEIRSRRLIRAGEDIAVELDVLGARRSPNGTRAAVRACLLDTGGALISESVTSVLLAGAARLEAFGTLPATTAPDRPDREQEPVTVVHEVTPEWIQRYARASGDDNPIHLDAETARAAGFPGVIAHGMSLLGLVCEEVTDRFAAGDASSVQNIGARFSTPVVSGADLRIELQPDRQRRTVAFTCRTAAGAAVKNGWVRFAGSRDGEE